MSSIDDDIVGSKDTQEDELDDIEVQEHNEHHILQNMKDEDDINNDDTVGSKDTQEDELEHFEVQEHDEHHILQNMKDEDDINNDDIVGSKDTQEDELDDIEVQEHDEHHILQNMKDEDDIDNDIMGSKDTQEDELDDIEILEREDLSDDSEDESCHSKEKNKSEPRVSIDPSERTAKQIGLLDVHPDTSLVGVMGSRNFISLLHQIYKKLQEYNYVGKNDLFELIDVPSYMNEGHCSDDLDEDDTDSSEDTSRSDCLFKEPKSQDEEAAKEAASVVADVVKDVIDEDESNCGDETTKDQGYTPPSSKNKDDKVDKQNMNEHGHNPVDEKFANVEQQEAPNEWSNGNGDHYHIPNQWHNQEEYNDNQILQENEQCSGCSLCFMKKNPNSKMKDNKVRPNYRQQYRSQKRKSMYKKSEVRAI
ncbi:nucleolin-like [Xenia sp. Carnegie-2017]|uniref:nucleolin-like n=1 Tax=Xenia sp. Carnegie-2017 TaxID=2897299 RepID=UPI001F04D088|nr:nucleolin-like [Xenia sp. Carnegie-2017]